jgi:hypothetical protein
LAQVAAGQPQLLKQGRTITYGAEPSLILSPIGG